MSFMYSLNFRTEAIYFLSLSLSMIYENKQHNILNKGHKTDSFRKSKSVSTQVVHCSLPYWNIAETMKRIHTFQVCNSVFRRI